MQEIIGNCLESNDVVGLGGSVTEASAFLCPAGAAGRKRICSNQSYFSLFQERNATALIQIKVSGNCLHAHTSPFSSWILKELLSFEQTISLNATVQGRSLTCELERQSPVLEDVRDNIMLAEESSGSVYPQEIISVVAVTWNLFGRLPPHDSLLRLTRSPSLAPPPDLVFVATQECQRSLFWSFCCEGKEEWEAMLREAFVGYTLIVSQTMRGLHSAVLVRNKLRDYFSVEGERKLRVGGYGVMGNKGAIGLEVVLLGQSLQLVNCHLSPHHSGSEARNQAIDRILDELVLQDGCDVVFAGDLNYRIEMGKEEYQMLHLNKPNTQQVLNYSSFLGREQLSNQPALQRRFLRFFEEGRIGFPPTYKMSISTNEYSRARVPGWTDRIFTRKRSDSNGLRCQGYTCEHEIMGCDHRPVVGRYSKLLPKNASSFGSRNRHRREAPSQCALI